MKPRKPDQFAHETPTKLAKHREIARRYARRKRKGLWPRTFSAIRLAELDRLYRHRYGATLPSSDMGEVCASVAVQHIGALRDAPRRAAAWLAHWSPWLGLASRERLIEAATSKPLRYRADKLAWKLRVTADERDGLNLRTIGAIDLPKAQRDQIAKLDKRERERQRRRANGAKPRKLYERNSISATKPWVDAGISRSHWYRKRRETK